MISSWSINHPSCNNLNDGSVYPIMFNSQPSTYIWSDGSVGATLKNVSAGIHTLFITDTNNCVEYHQFQLNDPYFISFGNIIIDDLNTNFIDRAKNIMLEYFKNLYLTLYLDVLDQVQ